MTTGGAVMKKARGMLWRPRTLHCADTCGRFCTVPFNHGQNDGYDLCFATGVTLGVLGSVPEVIGITAVQYPFSLYALAYNPKMQCTSNCGCTTSRTMQDLKLMVRRIMLCHSEI